MGSTCTGSWIRVTLGGTQWGTCAARKCSGPGALLCVEAIEAYIAAGWRGFMHVLGGRCEAGGMCVHVFYFRELALKAHRMARKFGEKFIFKAKTLPVYFFCASLHFLVFWCPAALEVLSGPAPQYLQVYWPRLTVLPATVLPRFFSPFAALAVLAVRLLET